MKKIKLWKRREITTRRKKMRKVIMWKRIWDPLSSKGRMIYPKAAGSHSCNPSMASGPQKT